MPLSLSNILLLLAAAQGFFLAALILHRHGRLFANRFLGTLMLVYSIILLHLFLGELGREPSRPHLIALIIGLGFLAGPLHYLYASYLVHSRTRFRAKDALHFTPFALFSGLILFDAFVVETGLLTRIVYAETSETLLVYFLFNWTILSQVSVYMVLTLLLLRRHGRYIRDLFSTIDRIKVDWLRNMTLLAMAFMLVFLLENVFFIFGVNLSDYFTLTSVLVAIYVYAIGYLGLFKAEVFARPEVAGPIRDLPGISYQSRMDHPGAVEKYRKSGLSPERAEHYTRELLNLMERSEPYTRSDLTLNQLADMLSISPHNLSEIINTRLQQNFFDFVNLYRVNKVKRDLLDPAKSHLKVLALAFDAGFNSKSSFNAIFKKQTRQTPSEFRRRNARPPA